KGNYLVARWMIAFPNNRRFIRMFFQMAIQTVGTDIQLAIRKPFNFKIISVKTGVFYLAKRFDPLQALCLFGPEFVWMFNGFLITCEILRICGTRGFFKFFWYWIDFFHYSRPCFCSISSREVNNIVFLII